MLPSLEGKTSLKRLRPFRLQQVSCFENLKIKLTVERFERKVIFLAADAQTSCARHDGR